MDVVDKATRSRMMAGIKGRNTKPELMLRRALHARGFRFRLHARGLAGRPDIVLKRRRAVVFVHGCFWHRHEGCRLASTPATREEFWASKFAANVLRDSAVQAELAATGWRIAIMWECALRKPRMAEEAIEKLESWLCSEHPRLELGEMDLRPFRSAESG